VRFINTLTPTLAQRAEGTSGFGQWKHVKPIANLRTIVSALEYCGHLHVCHCEPEALGGHGNLSLS
jgi:hypothetical protein